MFNSVYGSTKKLIPSQYLAEIIVKRRAERSGIVLPNLFWSDKSQKYTQWKLILVREVRFAAGLLKKADVVSILNVFNSKEGSFFLTWSNDKLHALVEREEQKRKQQEAISLQNKVEIIVTDINKKPNSPGGKKKNVLGKLRDL